MLAPVIPQDKVDDVRLLVGELVTNCVRHAELSPRDRVRVKLIVGDGRVRAEVSDPGRGFALPQGPDVLAESGWGMFLVEHISDRWGVENGEQTCVWFEVDT